MVEPMEVPGEVCARGAVIVPAAPSRAAEASLPQGVTGGRQGAAAASAEEAPTIMLPNQQSRISHLAIDIGGTLIKMVYFSRPGDRASSGAAAPARKVSVDESGRSFSGSGISSADAASIGRMHFVRFETAKIDECFDFIESKGLHLESSRGAEGDAEGGPGARVAINATGGGAHKFTSLFEQRLGLDISKLDEMECLVAGANFLLRAVRDEAFTYRNKEGRQYVRLYQDAPPGSPGALFPYLLVNIGSGVSMVRVDGPGKSQRVSGSTLGGGAFWGLCRLLTGCETFDEMLELSRKGDNTKVDMMVGDIYGGQAYESAGLSADTIASSFGKVVMKRDHLADYRKEDLALSLLRMIAYNIGQIAHLNAVRYGLKRVFFGGFFIRGHPFTMDTISFSINFWSKGEMQALFLRHEGFLGAIGAFVQKKDDNGVPSDLPIDVDGPSSRRMWVERFPIGAPITGGTVYGPPIGTIEEKVSWMERFVHISRKRHLWGTRTSETPPNGTSPAVSPPGSPRADNDSQAGSVPPMLSASKGAAAASVPAASSSGSSSDIDAMPRRNSITKLSEAIGAPGGEEVLGVLHLCEHTVFPLLHDPSGYEPNTVDMSRPGELDYWCKILLKQLPSLLERAVRSEGDTEDAQRRGEALNLAMRVHIGRLRAEPTSYGRLGLAEVLELREDCLREFYFSDAYCIEKREENVAAMTVLPDLLAEIDSLSAEARVRALIDGMLAGNIFDWGSSACVELFQNGSIFDIYRQARAKLARPFLVDHFDRFAAKALEGAPDGCCLKYKRALIFLDNAGADCVLGVLPLARELVRGGGEAVLVANSLPALNDVTASELMHIVAAAAELCPIIRHAAIRGGVLDAGTEARTEAEALGYGCGVLRVLASGHGGPCIDLRRITMQVADAARGADLVVLEGMGRALHTNLRATFKCDSIKLAMVKNKRLAETLFGGDLYDCVCCYQQAGEAADLPSPSM